MRMASMRESRDSHRFLVNTQVQSHALLRRGFGTSVPFIVCVALNSSSSFFGTASTPFSPSFCGPILHIPTARAVDFILSLALLASYICTDSLPHPQPCAVFYVSTQPPPPGYQMFVSEIS